MLSAMDAVKRKEQEGARATRPTREIHAPSARTVGGTLEKM